MEYNKKWLRSLRIESPSNSKATVIAEIAPYDGINISNENIQTIVLDDILYAMNDLTRPEEQRTLYATVMTLLLQAIESEAQYQATQMF